MRIRFLGLILLLGLGVNSCRPVVSQTPQDRTSRLQMWLRSDTTSDRRVTANWRMLNPRTRSPQLHDKQGLPNSKPGENNFSALVEVVPSRDLTGDVDGTFTDKWVDVAKVLVSHDNDAKLPVGYSCVYVRYNTKKANDRWEGTFGPASEADKVCEAGTTLPDKPNAKLLRVADTRVYPPAARLHLNREKNALQESTLYIGARCAVGWCYISQKETPKVKKLESASDVELIPGWHDDQYLAYWSSEENEFRQTKIWAKIVPDPTLKSKTFPDGGPMEHVATVTTEGTASSEARTSFRIRWGFDPQAVRTIEVYLQRIGGKKFRFELRANGTSVYREIEQGDHETIGETAVDIPGTARFGWGTEGESLWIRCDVGCCTVS